MQSSNEKAFELFCYLLFVLVGLFGNQVFCIETRVNSNLNLRVTGSAHPSTLPVETTFKFPSPLHVIPPGGGERNFGKGKIDLGGLEVIQISISTSTSQRVWRTFERGPDNMGVSIFQPINLPSGFFTLGFYAQPNNRMLFGWVLVARDLSGNSLRPPLDYIEVGNTTSLAVKQDGPAYFWQPLCPSGYGAVGLFVTTSPLKPPLRQESISCVGSHLTEQRSEADTTWVWRMEGINFYGLRPATRGTEATGVYTGTFSFQQQNFPRPFLSCLRNTKFDLSSMMPSQDQTRVLFRAYSPLIYFHPEEEFLPSSVDWIFSNGALLYQKGNESNPVAVQPNGSNLPQGGSDDDLYWLDYPADKKARERVKRGDLGNIKAYLHIKPMFGGTFTDIVVWIFSPFNGNARLKILFIKSLSLGDIGEHIGDWEHVTLRISNFNGELWRVYFSEHSGGSLVEACDLEFQSGNKPVVYSSLHGHAMFSKPGLVLQGQDGNNGLRNDMARSDKFLDAGADYEVIGGPGITEPPWLNYFRKWGPIVRHDVEKTLDSIAKTLPQLLRKRFRDLVHSIPPEVLQEMGPTGPKVKKSWSADE
ncbi:uncharacterized protein LOC106388692 [Brassica napus]|uniref:(rape) hypothetical protein n=1 Tax=Brassica napus TaxID=3708 RepID=A0A816I946_BRANA|nr:PREDICTED: uncharacterized protein LOC106335421 [Brassica oleracea var. oleracea]XP_013684276.2 uncharacterized protein LOC106388692 [Brassica napus]CAF1703020.1 unnamed protein product [Brassica napus]